MTLGEHEYHQYAAAHMKLLYYVGREQGLVSSTDMEAFLKLPFQKKHQCRDALYQNLYLLDSYIGSNVQQLHADEIRILQGFKKMIKSDFIILKCLTRYAVFIDSKTDLIYAVKALTDRFDDLFNRFPVYCHTTILPFKDKIIYDGFISAPGNIYLGSGLYASLNEKYHQAKKNKAIVTTL